MKKQLLMASILALGMGFAQAQNPAPMQSGAPDASARGSGAQTPAGDRGAAAGVASPTGTTDQAAAPQTFKGCLTGSTGSWSLAADNGQTLKLSGTDDQLSSYNNQQVNIKGTQATDGTVKVVSVDKISDSCNATGQAATSTGNTEQNPPTSQSPATSSTASQPPASSSTGAVSNQSTTTSNTESTSTTSTGQTGAAAPGQSTTGAASTSPSTGTPPVSEQTPANTVGGATGDQGAAQSQPSGVTGQSTTATGQSATTGSQSATTSGQSGNVPHISDMDQNQGAAGQNAGQQKLPQTASPLPLLGLMGLGSLVAGLTGRRRK